MWMEPVRLTTPPNMRPPRNNVQSTRQDQLTMPDVRSLSVPEGLEGERVDAALARLFGLSRTKAADLASAGAVTVDQRTVRKSDRVAAGAWLEAVSYTHLTLPTIYSV